jgi:peroxiredoxin Q/BCP
MSEEENKLAKLREYVWNQRRHHLIYHNHKETLAHAALVVMVSLTIGVCSKEWEDTGIDRLQSYGAIALWAGIYLYVGWELALRRFAAAVTTALNRCAGKLVVLGSLLSYPKPEVKVKNWQRLFGWLFRWIVWLPWSWPCIAAQPEKRGFPSEVILEVEKAQKEVDVRLMLMEIIMFVVSLICGLFIFVHSQNMDDKAYGYLEQMIGRVVREYKEMTTKDTNNLTQEGEMIVKLKVGDVAPGFELSNQDGKMVKLSDFVGKKILLYFYPKADMPSCTTQACSVRDSAEPLKDLGVVALGISPDEPDAQKKFDEKYSLGFTLLSDSHHKTAEAYGVWGEKSMYVKKYMGIICSSFLIDENGKIIEAWYKVSPADTVPNALAVIQARK